jgi:acyl carrier protein phosphodiesterase
MNYLGHAYLSFGNAALLTGNMIGDHVKGKHALEAFPEAIRAGLVLHRAIDTFTDAHEGMAPARAIFRPHYGLYAGAITDTLTDYFLANDPMIFPSAEELLQFSLKTYVQMAAYEAYFPASFGAYFASMRQHNWLYNYRSKEGIKRSLTGLSRRAKYLDDIDTAFRLFESHESQLRAHYQVFINDIVTFVKNAVKA